MPPETPKAPEQSQQSDAIDAESPRQEVSAPETDGARVAEAGHGYVGRQMDDRLKTTPRVEGSGESGGEEGGSSPDEDAG
jgi:hypothetical protein